MGCVRGARAGRRARSSGAGDGSTLGNSVDARDAYDPTVSTVSTGSIFLLGPGHGCIN